VAYVLVVDDDLPLTRMVDLLLSVEGIECRVAHEAGAALSLISHGRPDLILLDLRIPGSEPDVVLRDLHQAAPGVPVYAFTANSGDSDMPVNGTIHKPFDPDKLITAVRAALAGDVLE
jgi:DNA-binding response OmpR family regulator